MEKRVLLAVTLSFVVLVVYQTLFVKPVPRRPPASPPAAASGPTGGATVSQADQTPGNATAAVGASAVPAPATPATAEPVATTVVGDAEAREIVVESESIRAVFSNRGAELKSWQLKGYTDEQKQPIDILPAGLPPSEHGSVRARGRGPRPDRAASLCVVQAERDAPRCRARARRAWCSTTRIRVGSRLGRRYEFGHAGQPFVVNFSAAVQQNGTDVPVALSLGPGLGDTARATGSTSFLSPSYYQLPEGIMQRGRDVTRLPAAKLAATPVHGGAFTAVGVDDHYFLGCPAPGRPPDAGHLRAAHAADVSRAAGARAVPGEGRRRSRERPGLPGSEAVRQCSPRPTVSSCGRSTSACSTGWWSRSCGR